MRYGNADRTRSTPQPAEKSAKFKCKLDKILAYRLSTVLSSDKQEVKYVLNECFHQWLLFEQKFVGFNTFINLKGRMELCINKVLIQMPQQNAH